ncbi:hypothetical protein VST7929_01347 [Vibrio stylophorae]|uniref:DUF3466 family protein n=1 Tax=Vibrio stylophorae TaxID=659351 RepID=A0ABM8ZT62_9VIBR|nr:DUF3466 family protein [Vibrio stylophorae]CAH0533477.1 hypothetical protein VST7929_01347 [Vibrio stylophorae]
MKLKRTTLALTIAAALPAQAALYNVVEVAGDPNGIVDYEAQAVVHTLGKDCFAENANCLSDNYSIGLDKRQGTDGFSLRDLAPLNYDFGFRLGDLENYNADIEGGFEFYCEEILGYSTCESWAIARFYGQNYVFGGFLRDMDGDKDGYTPVTHAFINSKEIEPRNSVLNGMLSDGSVVGTRSGDEKTVNRRSTIREGFYVDSSSNLTALTIDPSHIDLNSKDVIAEMGQTTAEDAIKIGSSVYIVGSASTRFLGQGYGEKSGSGSCIDDVNRLTKPECQYLSFATQAWVWKIDDGANGPLASQWVDGGAAITHQTAAQAQARAIASVKKVGSSTETLTAVGFSSAYDDVSSSIADAQDQLLKAVVFESVDPKSPSEPIELNISYGSGNDRRYNWAMANDINSSGQIIGSAKLRQSQDSVYPQRSFYVDASNSPYDSAEVKFLNDIDSNVFFRSSNSQANAINDQGVMVGWVDVERKIEIDGTPRRHRAFVMNMGTAVASPLAESKAYVLDNLTAGDNADALNNQYRIFEAADINNDGVIAATAFKCDGGYASEASNASCNGTETKVAVKLVPINGATAADIVYRAQDGQKVERQGASFGAFGLALLGLFAWRRKRI